MKTIKSTLKVLFILLMIVVLMPLNSNASTQNSIDVSTAEEFIEAVRSSDAKIINVVSDGIDFIYEKPYKVLDVTGRTINLNNHTIKTDNMAVVFEGSNFTIKNGKIDAKGQAYALFIGDDGTTNNVIIENITATGGFNIYNSHNVVIKNCKVTGKKFYAIWCDQNGQAVVESGNFKTEGVAVVGLSASVYDTKLEIKGGNFVTNGKLLVLQGKDEDGYDRAMPEITGGTFDIPVDEKYYKSEYELVNLGENSYTVCNHASSEIRNKKEVTCTEEGYTGDKYCKKCGKMIENGFVVQALGHIASEWKNDGENHWKVCIRDGCNVIMPETKEAHSIKDGKCEICLSEVVGKLESVTDNKTSVKLEYNEGVLPENIILEVNEITKGTIYEKVKDVLPKVEKFTLFDINLLKDGVKIQPNGKVRVTIPVPEGFDKNKLVVYKIEENNKIEYSVTVLTIDNKIFAQYETDHFSNYVLAEKPKEENKNNVQIVEDKIEDMLEHKLDNEPETGVINNTVWVVVILTIISLVLLIKFIFRK